MKIGLIGCSATKTKEGGKAKDVYSASPLFRYSYRYAEKTCDKIFILSAKLGVVDPDAHIEPYSLSLMQLAKPERRKWAARVMSTLGARNVNKEDEFVFHCGRFYREFLERWIPKTSCPVDGLKIGERLRFYKKGLEK